MDALSAMNAALSKPGAAANARTATAAPLTESQKKALSHLHTAAQQFEGVFLGMMLKEMRATVPEDSLYGSSNAENMFTSMLDDQRAQSMAKSGSLGVAKMIETQLRGNVLANSKAEAASVVPTGSGL